MKLRALSILTTGLARVLTTGLAFAPLLVSFLGACDAAPATPAPDLLAPTESAPAALRGVRYCEVLLGRLAAPLVHVEVYNTIGLNECPNADWQRLDPAALARESGAQTTILNGPRYWTLDGFARGALVDGAVKTFGTIAMRQAGAIDLTLVEAQGMTAPYTPRTIQRSTVVRFAAGRPVYELVDDQARVFVMQSYSTQTTPQTAESLATLGARLKLPAGWAFRTRVLDQDLLVTAVNDRAQVLQDDLANSYQLAAP